MAEATIIQYVEHTTVGFDMSQFYDHLSVPKKANPWADVFLVLGSKNQAGSEWHYHVWDKSHDKSRWSRIAVCNSNILF